jgi:hypothetical protein
VTLVPTDGGQATPDSPTFGNGAYRIADVPPDLVAYTLHVEADGYAARVDSAEIVNPGAVAQQIPVTLTPVATVSGIARRENTTGSYSPASGPVILRNTDTDVEVTDATLGANGEFSFEVQSAALGPFEIELNEAGYKPVVVQVNSGDDVQLRQDYDVGTVTTRKYASATITVSGPSGGIVLDLTPAATVSGPTGGVFTVTNLDPDVAYTATVTHPNFDDKLVFSDMTPAVGATLSYTVVMNAKPATATITVSNASSLTNLQLAVSPTGPTVSGPTAAGVFTVTGLTSGTAFTFTLSADHYQNQTLNYTATPKGTFEPDAVTMVPKPATASISVSNTPVPAGLSLAVSPSTGVSGAGASASGSWSVTGLTPGTAYTFTITSTHYLDATLNYTATPEGAYAPAAVTLVPKPASASISVSNTPLPAGLNLAASPSTGVSGLGASTLGAWSVTGLAPGTAYTFTITSANFQDAVLTYTATPGGTFNPAQVTLVPKPPATASITVAGAAASAPGVNVTSTCTPANVTGTRTPSTDIWVFTVPVGHSCTFTASATGFTPATSSPAYVATASGTYSTTLTPTVIP